MRSKRTLSIPLKPVVKGSPEAKRLQQAQTDEVLGLTKAEELTCGGLEG